MRSLWRSVLGAPLSFAAFGLFGCEVVADFDRSKIASETTRPPGVAKPIPVPDVPPVRPDAGETDGAIPDASLMDGAVDGGVDDASTLDGGGDPSTLDGGGDASTLDGGGAEDAAVDAGDAGDAAVDAGVDAEVPDAGSDAGTTDAN